jgi:hypothetical protein
MQFSLAKHPALEFRRRLREKTQLRRDTMVLTDANWRQRENWGAAASSLLIPAHKMVQN